MTGIKSYAGYLKTAKEKNIIVVIMINHFTSESSIIKEQCENLINHIYLNY